MSRFPTAISHSDTPRVGQERRTDVVDARLRHEERNSRWADSRRSYNAGLRRPVSIDDLHQIIAFFQERRGWLRVSLARSDGWKSCAPDEECVGARSELATAWNRRLRFNCTQNIWNYVLPWARDIKKPLANTVRIAVAGVSGV